jgi:hypothetical protein
MLNKSLIVAGSITLLASGALAQSGPELMLNPMSKETRVETTVGATYFFDTDVEGGDVDFQMTRYIAQARMRLMPGQEADPRLGFSVSSLQIDTNLPGFPGSFNDVSISVGTGIAKFNGWVAGMTLGVGHSSTNTFGDGSGYYGMATVLFGHEIDAVSSFGLALDYNGNRSFMPDVPLPGFVYTRQVPEQRMEFSIGFPFAYGRYRPIDALLLEVNFTFPDFIGGSVSYDLTPGIGLYGSLAQRTESYHSPDLTNDVDSIIFEQTVAEAGMRFHVEDNFVLIVAGGYAFDQSFRTGFDSRETDKFVDINDGPFARIEGQFQW